MSDKIRLTEEIATNLQADVQISCTNCQQVYKLADCLKEEHLPAPYETVLEGFLVCPTCGDRKHSYYLPEHVRYNQTKLAKALQKWHDTHDKKDWATYKALHDSFKLAFDTAQKHYKELFGRDATRVEPGD